jgi:hypothetical protein
MVGSLRSYWADVEGSAREVEQIAGVLNTGAHRFHVAVWLSLQFLMYLAHGTFCAVLIPSLDGKSSVVSPRMVLIAGTTITSFKRSMTLSRVRISTGRRLSG